MGTANPYGQQPQQQQATGGTWRKLPLDTKQFWADRNARDPIAAANHVDYSRIPGGDTRTRTQPNVAPTGTGVAPPLPGGGPPAAAPPTAPPTGTESGPGILENWFQQRATGTDPAYEYTLGRGMDAIDNRMAAGGSFNSGARGQQLSDFGANMGAQREGQLDSLAAGASGEHRGRLSDMFAQMMGLSSGQAGLAGAYDLAAASGMSASDNAILQMLLGKAGVDSKADQGFLNNLFSIFSLGAKK